MSEDHSNYTDYGIVFDYDKTITNLCGGNLAHYTKIIQLLLKEVSFVREHTVLELGCGTGIGSEILLKNNFARLYCLDKSKAMLEATEYRLSNYGPHWKYGGDRHEFDQKIHQEGGNTYLKYYPFVHIPRVTLLMHDAYDIDNPQLLELGSRAVDIIVMANAWNSLFTPQRLVTAVKNRLTLNGTFVFNTKVKNDSLRSLHIIVKEEFYDPNFEETRYSNDFTDIPPVFTVEEVRSILEQYEFNVKCREQNFFLQRNEAFVYLQAAAQRFVRNYREKDKVTSTRVENLALRLNRTIDGLIEGQEQFFWRREAFFEAEKVN